MHGKSYFTSALPWTQRGNPVSVPISSNVTYKTNPVVRATGTGLPYTGATQFKTDAVNGYLEANTGGPDAYVYLDNISAISSSSLTVNALRQSVSLQEWLEMRLVALGI